MNRSEIIKLNFNRTGGDICSLVTGSEILNNDSIGILRQHERPIASNINHTCLHHWLTSGTPELVDRWASVLLHATQVKWFCHGFELRRPLMCSCICSTKEHLILGSYFSCNVLQASRLRLGHVGRCSLQLCLLLRFFDEIAVYLEWRECIVDFICIESLSCCSCFLFQKLLLLHSQALLTTYGWLKIFALFFSLRWRHHMRVLRESYLSLMSLSWYHILSFDHIFIPSFDTTVNLVHLREQLMLFSLFLGLDVSQLPLNFFIELFVT